MGEPVTDLKYRTYWSAIRRHVCSICLDQRSDGSCGLEGRVCAIERQLSGVVKTILGVKSDRMDDFVDAIESRVCTKCPEQDASGHCSSRSKGICALYTYLPFIVDAVEESSTRAQRDLPVPFF